jgi:hypothetical protein
LKPTFVRRALVGASAAVIGAVPIAAVGTGTAHADDDPDINPQTGLPWDFNAPMPPADPGEPVVSIDVPQDTHSQSAFSYIPIGSYRGYVSFSEHWPGPCIICVGQHITTTGLSDTTYTGVTKPTTLQLKDEYIFRALAPSSISISVGSGGVTVTGGAGTTTARAGWTSPAVPNTKNVQHSWANVSAYSGAGGTFTSYQHKSSSTFQFGGSFYTPSASHSAL